MTRIAFYLPNLSNGPGHAGILRLATELKTRGLEVRILADRDTGALAPAFAALEVRSLNAATPTLAGPALAKAVKAEAPDLIVAVGTANILGAALAKKLGLIKVPVVGWDRTQLSAPGGPGKIQARLIRSLYSVCDKVLFATNGAADDAIRFCAPAPVNVGVVHEPLGATGEPTALNAAEQEVLTRLALPRIVALGPLTRASDHMTLFRAFQMFSRAKEGSLLVIGSGDQRGALEVAATGLGLGNRIVFAGEVEDPTNLLALGHLFVSSAASDATGETLMRALALGIPVVATDCATAPREILDGGRYGRLTSVGDPRALSRTMREAMETTHYRPMLKARALEFSTARAADAFLAAIGATPASTEQGDQKAA